MVLSTYTHRYMSKTIQTYPSHKQKSHTCHKSSIHISQATRLNLASGAIPLGPGAPSSILPRRSTRLPWGRGVLPVADVLRREHGRDGVPRVRRGGGRPGVRVLWPRVPLRRWRTPVRLRGEALVLWRSSWWAWSGVRTRRRCLHKEQVM